MDQAPNDTRLWHPFADMALVRSSELVIERGEGIWVYDEEGRRYLDGTAALWYANVGHGRKEIADAIAAQLSRLEAYSIFGDLATRPTLELAERLAGLAPMPDPRVFFVSGGGEAIETATKLARLYWHALGRSERVHVVSRTNAYHGSHGFGTSLGGISPNRNGFGTLVPETTQIAHDSVEELERTLVALGPQNVAAFVFEPVIGAGGVLPPPNGYVEGVNEVCRSLNVLVVVDSTICGFGRLGTWLGFERFGIEPDMVVFAKGVTSGYLPLGGLIVSDRVANPFWSAPGNPFRHGPTYSGHATCCAAGLANLDILEREGLVSRGRELEGDLHRALAPLAEHPLVAEVRGGVGLMAAVELQADVLAETPAAPSLFYRAIRDSGGVLTRPLVRGVAFSPPLTITRAEIDLLAEGTRAGLERLEQALPVARDRVAAARGVVEARGVALQPPQLIVGARMLYLVWLPADPEAASALVPEELEAGDGCPVYLNQYVVEDTSQTSSAGSPEGFGAYSLTYLGLDLGGLDTEDGTPARWWTHYLNSSPAMIRYAAEHGVPAGSGRTTLELDAGELVATTSVDGSPVIRTTARVDLGNPERATGQLRYVTRVDGELVSGRYPFVADLAESFEITAVDFLDRGHPVYALRPAEPLVVTFGFYSPSISFCYPGGEGPLGSAHGR